MRTLFLFLTLLCLALPAIATDATLLEYETITNTEASTVHYCGANGWCLGTYVVSSGGDVDDLVLTAWDATGEQDGETVTILDDSSGVSVTIANAFGADLVGKRNTGSGEKGFVCEFYGTPSCTDGSGDFAPQAVSDVDLFWMKQLDTVNDGDQLELRDGINGSVISELPNSDCAGSKIMDANDDSTATAIGLGCDGSTLVPMHWAWNGTSWTTTEMSQPGGATLCTPHFLRTDAGKPYGGECDDVPYLWKTLTGVMVELDICGDNDGRGVAHGDDGTTFGGVFTECDSSPATTYLGTDNAAGGYFQVPFNELLQENGLHGATETTSGYVVAESYAWHQASDGLLWRLLPGESGGENEWRDIDGDQDKNHVDNCIAIPNPAQTDSDHVGGTPTEDGIGNACDVDRNDDCTVNTLWELLSAVACDNDTAPWTVNECEIYDHDGDDAVEMAAAEDDATEWLFYSSTLGRNGLNADGRCN